MTNDATTLQTPERAQVLTDEMIAEIKAFFPRYPTRQAVTIPALHVVNEKLRYVPKKAVEEIAHLLGLAPAVVQDTLTFYGYFHQEKPHGRTRVLVCRSISCALRGGDELIDHMTHELGIPQGGTTDDGAITLEPAECLGACEHAPCLLANKTLEGSVDHAKAKALIGAWKEAK